MARRRRAKSHEADPPVIRVESRVAHVVPYETSRLYLRTEIMSEGFHRPGCSPIVIFPRCEAGEATDGWVENVLAAPDESRRGRGGEKQERKGISCNWREVDVGILDVPISFRGPNRLLASNLERRSFAFLEENLKHLDRLLAGTFHDQMTLVTVFHVSKPDGQAPGRDSRSARR